VPAKCDVCGKIGQFGNSIKRRGKAKYLGGVGRKTTGITRRRFNVNLQEVRAELPSGERKRVRVCVKCLRSGRVIKRTVREIPAPAAK
jgi:large subunit ribosomal protein L28